MSTHAANRQERTDAASEEELRREILREIRPKGFFLEPGHRPCTCGADHIKTTKRPSYSDGAIYTHRCRECGHRFQTYIEG